MVPQREFDCDTSAIRKTIEEILVAIRDELEAESRKNNFSFLLGELTHLTSLGNQLTYQITPHRNAKEHLRKLFAE